MGSSYLVNIGFASSKTLPEAYLRSLPDILQIDGTCSEMYPLRDAGAYRTGNPSEYAIPPLPAPTFFTMAYTNFTYSLVDQKTGESLDLF